METFGDYGDLVWPPLGQPIQGESEWLVSNISSTGDSGSDVWLLKRFEAVSFIPLVRLLSQEQISDFLINLVDQPRPWLNLRLWLVDI